MRKGVSLHPLLFGAFPVLFIYAHNLNITPFGEILVPLLFALSCALAAWFLMYLVFRNRIKSAVSGSFIVLLFFSFGHLRRATAYIDELAGDTAGPAIFLLLVAAALVLLVLQVRTWGEERLRVMNALLNLVAAALVVLSVASIIYKAVHRGHGVSRPELHLKTEGGLPDIYYIVLDAYGRSDVLSRMYGFDNSGFMKFLMDNGFYVAGNSKSNYALTPLSLASSLNFTYLDGVASEVGEGSDDGWPLIEMIHDSDTAGLLRSLGYKVVIFSSGSSYTEMSTSDVRMAPRWALSEFMNVLINTTPVTLLMKVLRVENLHGLHRDRICYILDNLSVVPREAAPNFVFAHVLAPHHPFVFGENGEELTPDREFYIGARKLMSGESLKEYRDGYRGQAAYVTKRIEDAIKGIISNAGDDAIIIIQGDHGPGSTMDWFEPEKTNFWERMSILNAYRLPGGGEAGLYPDITPVNTFRLVFKRYFGADIELLEDRSYYSTAKNPYEFIDVTGKARPQVYP